MSIFNAKDAMMKRERNKNGTWLKKTFKILFYVPKIKIETSK